MLLRVIEHRTFRLPGLGRDRHVDVRVIAAAPRDLAMEGGNVIPALRHRLELLTITLPPLRERGDDVIRLAEHFARSHAQQYGIVPRPLAAEARELLFRHAWPGNVRELSHEIERSVLLDAGGQLTLAHLRGSLAAAPRPATIRADAAGVIIDLPPEGVAFDLIERGVIARTLELAGGNVTRAARLLGLSRDTLRYRIERLNL